MRGRKRTPSAKPTRTTNELHFTDLSPRRFEDLCLALIQPLHPWVDLRHYGRSGDDRGVDIHTKERMEDGVVRSWFVQCRRYARATKATLLNAVDDALAHAKTPPDVLLVVVACDVSRDAHEAYEQYAADKGVATPFLWSGSFLEATLRSQRRDLLFTYFGISDVLEERQRELRISRNINMKQRLARDLRVDPKDVDIQKLRAGAPYLKFARSSAIIHNVDDDGYPELDSSRRGISGWFKLEFWNFYYNGIEFILSIRTAVRERSSDRWALIERGDAFDASRFEEVTVWQIAQIPYRNIVEYDLAGDEYYPGPHFYCRFADGGTPYEGIRYALLSEGEYACPMKRELQFEFRREERNVTSVRKKNNRT